MLFKVALKILYMRTPFTLWMNFLLVQMIRITDLYDCVNSYTVIILCFVCFCTFLTCSTSYCLVTASWIYGMHICMYVKWWGCVIGHPPLSSAEVKSICICIYFVFR